MNKPTLGLSQKPVAARAKPRAGSTTIFRGAVVQRPPRVPAPSVLPVKLRHKPRNYLPPEVSKLTFYVNWSPSGKAPTARKATAAEALAEATRLRTLFPDRLFYTYRCTALMGENP